MVDDLVLAAADFRCFVESTPHPCACKAGENPDAAVSRDL